MSRKKYWILTSLATFIVLPIVLNGILLLSARQTEMFYDHPSIWWLSPLLGLLLLLLLIYLVFLFGKKATLPETFLSRYAPFIAPILAALVVWIVIAFFNGGDFSLDKPIAVNYGLFYFAPSFLFAFFALILGEFWLIPVATVLSCLFFAACFAVGTWRSKRFRTTQNKSALWVLLLFLALAVVAVVQNRVQYHSVLHPDPNQPEVAEYDLKSWLYIPFRSESKLIAPKTPPSLQFDHDYPKLDGAEAFVPVYAAAANAIYRKNEKQIGDDNKRDPREEAVMRSEATPAAFSSLLDGRADMIFTLAPSEEQKKEAADKGVTYTLTPIGREAFVFLVNEQNPITGLTVEQLRDIYSGKINDWKEIGGTPGKIMAFQRNEGSGSQTVMLRDVMRDTPMRKPLIEENIGSMGGLRRAVADYRNYGNAIGYSFRYYATTMSDVPNLRLLTVNGIAPTEENIRNGSYPFTEDFYIVTARPLPENAAKLRDWFVGDEGQRFIEEVGYVPLTTVGVSHAHP